MRLPSEFDPEMDRSIDFFFKAPPAYGRESRNTHSVLYLLRRDLRDISGPEEEPPDLEKLRAPILASFGVMAAFELLARVWTGINDFGKEKAGHRLTACYEEFVDVENAALLKQFRNAIGHGYELIIQARDGKVYHFGLRDEISGNEWFKKTVISSETVYVINFWELRWRFLKAISRMKSRLKDLREVEPRRNFRQMIRVIRPYTMKW
jgi:hypothetical protein